MGDYGLGIDVGTTFTAAAIARDGRSEIVGLGSRRAAIPTVVFLTEDGRSLTGEAAEARASSDPSRVARAFKRRLGDTTPLLLGGSPSSPEALFAAMIRDVVALVSEREGEPPRAIALTHPANWGPYKLELLEHATRLAGLTDVRFVPEPTAAAVQYASTEGIDDGEVVAVYDFGGGTFDASVLRRRGNGFELLGRPDGVERLGGIDIDEALLAHVSENLGPQLESLDPEDPTAVRATSRLREECTLAKEALSGDTEAEVSVLLPNVSTTIRITRAELEQRIRPALGPSIDALRRSIASAGLVPKDIDRVLLVGGSSRIPLVAQVVTGELGLPVALDADPKHVVAMGAARIVAPATAPVATVAPPTSAPAPPAPPTPPSATAPTTAATPSPRSSSRSRTPLLLGIGVVAVIAIIAAVVVASRGGSSSRTTSSNSSSATSATTTPVALPSGIDRAKGLASMSANSSVPTTNVSQAFSLLYANKLGTDKTAAAPASAGRAYDATLLVILSARAATTDGGKMVEKFAEIADAPGTACSTFEDCAPLVADHQDIDLGGSVGSLELGQYGDNVGNTTYSRVSFDVTNHATTTSDAAQARPVNEVITDVIPVPPRVGDGTLVIGLLPDAGSSANDPDRVGAQIAIDEVNASGGLNGKPVELAVSVPSTFGDPAAIHTAAAALLSKHVDAVVATSDLGQVAVSDMTAATIPTLLTATTAYFDTIGGNQTSHAEGLAFSIAPSLPPEVSDGIPVQGAIVVLNDDALAPFADAKVTSLQSQGAFITRVHVNASASTFEDVGTSVANAHPEGIIVLTGRETPAVIAWLIAKGIDVTKVTLLGYSGNVTDAVGQAFANGLAYAAP